MLKSAAQAGLLCLLSLGCTRAFQSAIPSAGRANTFILERAPGLCSTRAGAGSRLFARSRLLHPPRAVVIAPCIDAATLAIPLFPKQKKLKAPSSAASRSSLLGAALFVSLMKIHQVGAAAAPSLLAHGCAGVLGGFVAVISDSTFFEQSQSLWQSLKFTAITKAVNSITFAYLQEAVSTFSLGSAGGIMLASAGTGIAATLIQSCFAKRGDVFFKRNVGRNVLLFNTLWFTYLSICAISPVIPGTYMGVGLAGAFAGMVSTIFESAVHSWQRLRYGFLSTLRQGFKDEESLRGALQSGIVFVVYQAVYSALV
jgi:hypothetical protein